MARSARFQIVFRRVALFLMVGSVCLLFWQAPRESACSQKRSLSVADVLASPREYADDLPACSAVVRGDLEGPGGDNLSQLLGPRKRSALRSEAFYLNATRDCRAYAADRGFATTTLSEEERDFPIAYSMVIHEKIEMFERLLRAVYAPQNVYCVHVDRKSPDEFQNAVKAIASCFPNVFVASQLESVVYASWSRVQADLNCMKDLLNSTVQWRYLLNTCGSDFPIKTNAEMVRALTLLNGKNSLETEVPSDHKRGRWEFRHVVADDNVVRTDDRKSPPPISSPMFTGNAYFVVTRDFVRRVFDEEEEVRKLLEWAKDTYSPDEHLWATLQRMPSVPGSRPANEKYHASDMAAIARVVKWSYLAGDVNRGAPYPECTGAYRRAVCVYGAGDLQWLLQQHHLIANKFDPEVDDVAIRCLESILHYKAINRTLWGTEESSPILR